MSYQQDSYESLKDAMVIRCIEIDRILAIRRNHFPLMNASTIIAI